MANALIVVVSVLLVVTLFQQHFSKDSRPKPESTKSGLEIGAKVQLTDFSWNAEGQTLVFVLNKACRFCVESMPFYKQIVERAGGTGIKLLAVFPGDLEESSIFLEKHGISNIEVKQARLADMNIRGTPTIILANGEGVVTDIWTGMLTPEKQKTLLDRIL